MKFQPNIFLQEKYETLVAAKQLATYTNRISDPDPDRLRNTMRSSP